jgi:hypothetical protein
VSFESRPISRNLQVDSASKDLALLGALKHAAKFNMCVSTSCTTCGGYPFAKQVLTTLKRIGYDLPDANLLRDTMRHPATQRAILVELKKISELDDGGFYFVPAARYLIFRAYCVLSEDEIETILRGSWAGRVYQSMKDHYAAIQERKRNAFREQQEQKTKNAERRRIEAEIRSQRKIERDELWCTGRMKSGADQ